ncbi:hypothetical protein [Kribbella sp. NPDC051770]|uniref:hypothetical protein n=1 Tax=Kribbella sp. NPDC051770 TaxID=3155413 RepID=UPI00341DA350
MPTSTSCTRINRGDIAAWAGDWITFYGDWRRNGDQVPGDESTRAALYDGPQPRLALFFADRFRAPELATAIARSALTDAGDLLIDAGRTGLITDIADGPVLAPAFLRGDALERLTQGFTERLLELVAEERELIAALPAYV